MRPAGIKHDVMNGSPHPIAFVEIEVKQPADLAGHDGLAARRPQRVEWHARHHRARNTRMSSHCRTGAFCTAAPTLWMDPWCPPLVIDPSADTVARTLRMRSRNSVPAGSAPDSTKLPKGIRGASRRDGLVARPSSGRQSLLASDTADRGLGVGRDGARSR